jgi:hypothetical protein
MAQPIKSFTRALVFSVIGLVTVLGVILLAAMAWQGAKHNRQAEQQEMTEVLTRSIERVQMLLRAAEMTADSLERLARAPRLNGDSLRPALNQALAAFEQRPELSYMGLVVPETGEYGNIERTAQGELLLWLFPGTRPHDPVTRRYP